MYFSEGEVFLIKWKHRVRRWNEQWEILPLAYESMPDELTCFVIFV